MMHLLHSSDLNVAVYSSVTCIYKVFSDIFKITRSYGIHLHGPSYPSWFLFFKNEFFSLEDQIFWPCQSFKLLREETSLHFS